MDWKKIYTSKIVTTGLFFVIILITVYLYQRSFKIVYENVTLAQHHEQPQEPAKLLFGIAFTYLTMSIIWPVVLTFLLVVYRRYANLAEETIFSKAIMENKDLSLALNILIGGALVIHFLVYSWLILDGLNDSQAIQQMAGGSEERLKDGYRKITVYAVAFLVAAILSVFLYIRSMFKKTDPK